MNISIYCDGADLAQMEQYAEDDRVAGFTSNPSLLRKAGITDYAKFAKLALDRIKGKPISFEVLADDWPTMEAQARIIQGWGENVYVKLPITNTKGELCSLTASRLGDCNLNITAVFTPRQYGLVWNCLKPTDIISVFAGRIMDTGLRPKFNRTEKPCQLLWASTRAIYDVVTAEVLGFDVITITPEMLKKLDLFGKDLEVYSRETVAQFHEDGQKAGLTL